MADKNNKDIPDTPSADKPAGALKRLFTSSTKSLAEPEKEIRFTRSAQASTFFTLAVISAALSVSSLFCIYVNWGPHHYDFKENWWLSLLPLIPALLFFRMGIHCIRHAYLILSPMGVEIFPFWKPQKNLQVIFWSDIDHAEFDSNLLKLHYNKDETSGIILSLKPISKQNYPLLEHAIQGRLNSN